MPETASIPVITHLPVVVLNLHSNCNCRCVMCDIWKRTDTSEFNLVRLKSLISELRDLGAEWVVLTGGEPLLHSEFSGVCSLLKDAGLRITLLSSGLLLKKRAHDITNFVSDVIISLDGPPDIHDRIRGIHGAYKLIAEGITQLRSLSPAMNIAARTTVQSMNGSHLCSTVETAHALGLNRISLLAADITSQAFNRELVWPIPRQNAIAFTRDQLSTLASEIERLIVEHRHDMETGFIAEGPQKLRRIVRYFRAHLGDVPFEAPRCNAPWVSAVIETDGSVRPCFFHAPLGNLANSSLLAVLDSEHARDFRRTLDMATDPTCRRCVCSLNY